jgi:SpoVK/Ycf46/Vps4 family AAA+-type ATPase
MVGDATFERFSGTDLTALVREAGVIALRGSITNWDRTPDQQEQQEEKVYVLREDFVLASAKVGPSVSVAQRGNTRACRRSFQERFQLSRRLKMEVSHEEIMQSLWQILANVHAIGF